MRLIPEGEDFTYPGQPRATGLLHSSSFYPVDLRASETPLARALPHLIGDPKLIVK